MSNEEQAVVGIVGAGLVGALNAIYFAQRGWKVELYELRPGKYEKCLCTLLGFFFLTVYFPTIIKRYATPCS